MEVTELTEKYSNEINETPNQHHPIFRARRAKDKKVTRPIIRKLRVIEPDDALLKQLGIKDPEDYEWRSHHHKMSEDYQIIGGEVVVNGVTFQLYFVIGKEERLFTDQVIMNSNMSPEEASKYSSSYELLAFQTHILNSLSYLARVDREILETIKEDSDPIICFKSSKKYDYRAVGTGLGGYASDNRESKLPHSLNVNFPSKKVTVVHEFGHLFDNALEITTRRNDDIVFEKWRRLAKKYSTALKATTALEGKNLSGYKAEEYESMGYEFFADLFNAYFIGDKAKGGPYLIELLDEEAFLALEEEIAKVEGNVFKDQLFTVFAHKASRIKKMAEYFSATNDQELANLIVRFLEEANTKILYSSSDNTNSIHFNALIYNSFSPIMDELLELYKQYIDNPTAENKNKIKETILTKAFNVSNTININQNVNLIDYQDYIAYLESIRDVIQETDSPEVLNVINDFIDTLKNYTEEERTVISKGDIGFIIDLFNKRINSKKNETELITVEEIAAGIDSFKERVQELAVIRRESKKQISVEPNEEVSSQNKKEALKKLQEVFDLLVKPTTQLPEKVIEEMAGEMDSIQGQIEEFSKDGFTSTELKMCLVVIGGLINRIGNYYNLTEMVRRQKERLTVLRGRFEYFLKADPRNDDIVFLISLIERCIELFNNESLFKGKDKNSNMYGLIYNLDKVITNLEELKAHQIDEMESRDLKRNLENLINEIEIEKSEGIQF